MLRAIRLSLCDARPVPYRARPMAASLAPIVIHLRRALALPIYVVALLLSLLGDALGVLAAKIAGDE